MCDGGREVGPLPCHQGPPSHLLGRLTSRLVGLSGWKLPSSAATEKRGLGEKEAEEMGAGSEDPCGLRGRC